MMVTQAEKRHGSLFGPIVLIGLGVLLLLSNFGVLNFNLWELLFRFWPLFLVAAGLDLLLGRRTNSGALVALVVIVGLVIGGVWLGYVQSNAFEAVTGQTLHQALEGAQRAEITIESSISQMQIAAGAPSTQLVEGAVSLHNNEELKTDFAVEDGVARYTLKSDSQSFILPSFGRREDGLWDLKLNGATPTDLSISTGVGSAKLNLAQLMLTGLDVSTGVGEVEITLPESGVFDAAIEGGVGKIVVLVPDTLAAQITADAGIGSVTIDGDYIHRGDTYISPNFDGAENRVTLAIGGGVGPVTVRQVSKE